MKTSLKTSLLVLLISFFGIIELFGQLKVFNNNYVGINQTTTPASRFVINEAGNSASSLDLIILRSQYQVPHWPLEVIRGAEVLTISWH